VAELPIRFAGLLRGRRAEAGLTQEELAEAAGLTARAISDLERGVVTTPHKETVRLLAEALRLDSAARAEFEANARGRSATGGVPAAMRALPRDVVSFTGRGRELAALEDAAVAGVGLGGLVSIHAIGGMAGVGKTAFAVHAAHRLAARYPAGQLFLPLHGHTAGQDPVDPSDALASLLQTIGVVPGRVPADLEARAALWRDRVADRPLLLVLDDAVGSDQVRPLLPGSGGSLVLVTSRRRLTGLEDATTISLDILRPAEAAELLVRLAGRPGLSPADVAVQEVIRLCGYLPLAIGMLARQLYHHRAWTVAGRAAELSAAVDRLELLATENISVAAAFDLSYSNLGPDQQRQFRRLGLHPGADIDGFAAAALNGTDPATAGPALQALYDQHLLTEPAPGRYRMHDLIREHAKTLARRDDSDDEREQATDRLLDYYQHTAALANARIARQTRPGPAADSAALAAAPDLADAAQALAWARAERASLLACLDLATTAVRYDRIIALTAGLSGLLQRDGPWTDAITRHTTAIAAAQQLGDQLGHAGALNDVGTVWRLTDDNAAAARAHKEALGIYRRAGNMLGEACALLSLGSVGRLTGEHTAAARYLEQALAIYRQIDDRAGVADALKTLGDVRQMMGDIPAAAKDLKQALAIYRDLGDQLGQGDALNAQGAVLRLTGDYPAAAQAHEQALGIYRETGHRLGEANALHALGDVHLLGDYLAAVQAQEQALEIYRQIGSRLGAAVALHAVGYLRRLNGDYPAAAEALDQAIAIFHQIGHPTGEAEALNQKGRLHQLSGDLKVAKRCHEQALQLSRAIDSSVDEAHALAGLGRCARAAGRTAEAQAWLQQALVIFQRLGVAEVDDVSAELLALSA
jgi:tetratricopeptide (TPR) repeat protein/transcriptional regulator with XRE-family HTH domain